MERRAWTSPLFLGAAAPGPESRAADHGLHTPREPVWADAAAPGEPRQLHPGGAAAPRGSRATVSGGGTCHHLAREQCQNATVCGLTRAGCACRVFYGGDTTTDPMQQRFSNVLFDFSYLKAPERYERKLANDPVRSVRPPIPARRRSLTQVPHSHSPRPMTSLGRTMARSSCAFTACLRTLSRYGAALARMQAL